MSIEHTVEKDRYAQARARRWLLVAAGAWLLLPVLGALRHESFRALGFVFTMVILSVLVLLWAARLSQARGLRAAILTRGVAASNLIVALLFAVAGSPGLEVFLILLAVSAGRSLQLLGLRGLDGGEDPTSSFQPLRFRGLLTFALVLACADALTLLSATSWMGAELVWSWYFGGYYAWTLWLPEVGATVAAAAMMVLTAWGLFRLRVWALLCGMIGNFVIAGLALVGVVIVGDAIATAMLVTGVVQVLLALPILASALGLRVGGTFERGGALVLRLLVPGAVVAAIGAVVIRSVFA